MSSAPIADLTYRSYDGPIESPRHRWWVIAKMLLRMTFKKKGFWWWAGLSGLTFYFTSIILYVFDSLSSAAPVPNEQANFLRQIVWKELFVNGFGSMQMWLLFIALTAGAGAIANDNRANALLVYLSKPCRKIDYLIGKWVGVAILISGVTLAQFTLFYLLNMMSYREYGFLTQDPWLYPKLVLVSIVPGVIYASLVIGISSMFNQGRLAGATFAGLYFVTYFFTTLMLVFRAVTMQNEGKPSAVIDNLSYLSVDGLNFALCKIILNTKGSVLMQNPRQREQAMANLVPPPDALLFTILPIAICAFFVWIAWKRIRAVEVVS